MTVLTNQSDHKGVKILSGRQGTLTPKLITHQKFMLITGRRQTYTRTGINKTQIHKFLFNFSYFLLIIQFYKIRED